MPGMYVTNTVIQKYRQRIVTEVTFPLPGDVFRSLIIAILQLHDYLCCHHPKGKGRPTHNTLPPLLHCCRHMHLQGGGVL